MTPASLNLGSVVDGDTWNGFNEVSVTVDGVQPESSLASVSMKFIRKQAGGRNRELELKSSANQIEITSAAAWQFRVKPAVMRLDDGIYNWTLRTTDSTGAVKTYLIGTITII